MEKKDFFEVEEKETIVGGFHVNIEDFESEDDLGSEIQEDAIDFNQFTKFEAKHENKKPNWWKQLKKWQKGLIITAVALLLVVSIIIGVVLSVFDYNYNKISANSEDLGFESVIDEKIVNVALFGIDTRRKDSFKGLSDSIMILSLNTKTKEVKIISVMRDSFVPITYKGKTTYGKINSAYSKGGPELAIKTLNTVFDLDISEYATVNFYGMADIIDAVGGIDAELTQGEVVRSDGTQRGINGCIDEICENLGLNPDKYHITTAGKHKLNGVQAVAYSRIRYVANIWGTINDYGRTDRQRYVMEQLFNKALTMKKSQYVTLAQSLIPCCETSLSYSEIMGLALDILLDSPTFLQTRIPQPEYQMTQPAGVGSVVYYDLDFASKLIHAYLYEGITFEEYVQQNGVNKNDWYGRGSLPAGSSNSSTSSNESTSSAPVVSAQSSVTSNTSSNTVTSAESEIVSGSSSETVTSSGSGNVSGVTNSQPLQSSQNQTSSTTETSEGTTVLETDSSGNTGDVTSQSVEDSTVANGDSTATNSGSTEPINP